MAKKKDAGNYLELIPVRNPAFPYTVADDGIVTISVEWQGFYHRIAQRFFRRPRVSDIKLDAYGSFVWRTIDGEKKRIRHLAGAGSAVFRHGQGALPPDQISGDHA